MITKEIQMNHTILYKNNGDIIGFGDNFFGQLGIAPTHGYVRNPKEIENNKDIKFIRCGYNHTFLYKNNGELYGFGFNACGQLGKDPLRTIYPGLILVDNDINDIICSEYITLIYKNNGDLCVMGQYWYPEVKYKKMEVLLNDKYIKKIICGKHHTILYKKNGDLMGIGDNSSYQLGNKKINNIVYHPILIINDNKIKYIACGDSHTLIYRNNGGLYGFGNNKYGQLGLSTKYTIVKAMTFILKDNTIKNIICGSNHTILYKINGDLLVCGDNTHGQLGFNKITKYIYYPQLLFNDTDIIDITCGQYHTLIYKKNGDLYGFGINDRGQTGKYNEYEYNMNFILNDEIKFLNNNVILHDYFHPQNMHRYSYFMYDNIIIFLLICKSLKKYKLVVPKLIKYKICNHIILN